MEASTRRRPSTQAQRRAETRAALLDATIECLVTYGYAKTTTGRVAELAGVSRGAQIPYFRSRAELVGAAVAHLADQRIESVRERFATNPISVEELLDVIWEEHQGNVFDATLELWVASRTDPELRKTLRRIERDVAATVAREVEAAVGPKAGLGFTDDLIFALSTIRGLALLRISNGASSRALAEQWSRTRERLLRVLA
jgi:AcrR family transcriptional regulator